VADATLLSASSAEAEPRRDDRQRRPRNDEVIDGGRAVELREGSDAQARDRRDRPRDGRERDRRRTLPDGDGRRAQPLTATTASAGLVPPLGAGPVGPHSPVRDYASWSPPAEAGDDEPLLPSNSRQRPEARDTASAQPSTSTTLDVDDGSYVELFMGVGRRDGVRAQDLFEGPHRGGRRRKDNVRRIRVRDRHAFVAVRREDATRAAGQLNGSSIAGKPPSRSSFARERPPEDPSQDVPVS
jgi:ATP-dependent RNA helicase DeaD